MQFNATCSYSSHHSITTYEFIFSFFFSLRLLICIETVRLCTIAPTTTSSPSSSENVAVDRIIWHLVKLFGNPFDNNLVQRCDKLVKFIGNYQPDLKTQLSTKSSSFESAIQGEMASSIERGVVSRNISNYTSHNIGTQSLISYPII